MNEKARQIPVRLREVVEKDLQHGHDQDGGGAHPHRL